MRMLEALSQHFPGVMTDADFVSRSFQALQAHGFEAQNTFAGVGLCRDELTRPLADKIKRCWGETFNVSSLAGMLFLGKAGFTASLHHAPDNEKGTRHVYFSLPHIGINSLEEIGFCYRPGQKQISKACGALVAFREELLNGSLRVDLDPDDLEQSLLKQRLIRKLHYGKVPGLITLTKLAYASMLEDLERMIHLTMNAASHYAIVTGIHIHGPNNKNYVWPSEAYVVVDGRRNSLLLNQRVNGKKA